ncbi:maleylpyruvate isomerase family mycothiol-dependent enzyme [Allokutzneria sp. A3M-2-11 16]|uniref:maleylpyruvate isomerase family mycothiol-dependent enzyme n=1 Tax=Allokutzneria sp. A3M-2-11 16 TaxID=2962043 RepID=UPI0020B7D340|nr:maleylpyruvate isomerase family mycothiol-dependent enzyme [Allokutzneria sp. A3M-2-11 16]MCP3798024.1 maleylpyruvate isomerase family mycothiol-dependent enzyme [Allokutzneria sp. A3M-2-11 16]
MEWLTCFQREAGAFEGAVRRADGQAPIVPSCPQWTLTDLVLHLGYVHRVVTSIVTERLTAPPDVHGTQFRVRHPDWQRWPSLDEAPNHGPLPAGLADWFAEGAAALHDVFRADAPDTPVWTWTADQTVGFWIRMQTTEAALHRWDAQNAFGDAWPIDDEHAALAITEHFELLVPAWRHMRPAEDGAGERVRLTDGRRGWTVEFTGDEARYVDAPAHVELAGTASDLLLFLWNRIPADHLAITGDRAVLDRYTKIVPPV